MATVVVMATPRSLFFCLFFRHFHWLPNPLPGHQLITIRAQTPKNRDKPILQASVYCDKNSSCLRKTLVSSAPYWLKYFDYWLFVSLVGYFCPSDSRDGKKVSGSKSRDWRGNFFGLNLLFIHGFLSHSTASLIQWLFLLHCRRNVKLEKLWKWRKFWKPNWRLATKGNCMWLYGTGKISRKE